MNDEDRLLERGLADVGGGRLAYQLGGSGNPEVVFERGLESGSASLAAVARQVATFTRVCLYDRARLGTSDPPRAVRTSAHMARELHALLAEARVSGPSVLVGQSIAGLNLRVYAAAYPADVAGMVLIDAAHPDQWTRMLRRMGAEHAGESWSLTACRTEQQEEWTDPTRNRERMDIAASAALARLVTSLGDIPLVVITAGLNDFEREEDIPPDVAVRIQEDWLAQQLDLARLSPRGRHVIAERSYHVVQNHQPDLVVEAIWSVVQAVREGRMRPSQTVGHEAASRP